MSEEAYYGCPGCGCPEFIKVVLGPIFRWKTWKVDEPDFYEFDEEVSKAAEEKVQCLFCGKFYHPPGSLYMKQELERMVE